MFVLLLKRKRKRERKRERKKEKKLCKLPPVRNTTVDLRITIPRAFLSVHPQLGVHRRLILRLRKPAHSTYKIKTIYHHIY